METEAIGGGLILFNLFFFGTFFLFGIGVFAFWIWMLVDCLQKEPSEGNDKLIWMLVIVLANWVGALVYFFVRKMDRDRRHRGGPRHGPRRGTPPALRKRADSADFKSDL